MWYHYRSVNTLLALAVYAIFTTKAVAGEYILGTQNVRAEHAFSLSNRYADPGVNDVFRYNILHTLERMDAKSYSFTLNPGEVFAFHDDVLPQFKGRVAQTMNAHFNYEDGFKSDGYLMGDGVCHLASLLYWAARDAGLATLVPTNHNFADIPEVPKEYGVSIFAYDPMQNLYITNTFDKPVRFTFVVNATDLTVKITD